MSILIPASLAARAGDTSPSRRYEYFVFISFETDFTASMSGAKYPFSVFIVI